MMENFHHSDAIALNRNNNCNVIISNNNDCDHSTRAKAININIDSNPGNSTKRVYSICNLSCSSESYKEYAAILDFDKEEIADEEAYGQYQVTPPNVGCVKMKTLSRQVSFKTSLLTTTPPTWTTRPLNLGNMMLRREHLNAQRQRMMFLCWIVFHKQFLFPETKPTMEQVVRKT